RGGGDGKEAVSGSFLARIVLKPNRTKQRPFQVKDQDPWTNDDREFLYLDDGGASARQERARKGWSKRVTRPLSRSSWRAGASSRPVTPRSSSTLVCTAWRTPKASRASARRWTGSCGRWPPGRSSASLATTTSTAKPQRP